MVLRLLIDAVHTDETRVVIADGNRIHDFDFITAAKKQLKGNIYLAKITRVEPSLQAAFVEYGGGKQGFLPFAEIHPDYYQIPTADRQRLLEEAEEAAEREEAAEGHHEPAHHDTAHNEHAEPSNGHLPEIIHMQEHESAAHPAHEPDTQPHAIETPAVYSDAAAAEPTTGEHSLEPYTAEVVQTEAATAAQESHAAEPAEAGENQEVETLASDEDAVRQSRSPSFFRRYKIQEVIKRNQIVLVQVIKEERGNKGCSLTTFISLAGRYCVLMPNSPKGGGISRKIMSGEDRKRLKEISAELKTARGMSAIIRTAGIDRTRAEIKRDYEYLMKKAI
jgi:ribonuclease E